MKRIRTQAGIVGAGPAGLVLAHLLHLAGIESVIVEQRSRQYCEDRIRAGVLEQTTVDLLRQVGMAERMDREGLMHHGIELGFRDQRHRIDMADLTGGKGVTVYGQHEVVKDFIARRVADGLPLFFESSGVSVFGAETDSPSIRFLNGGEEHELACDYIAGCDGFHGICRPSIPASALTLYDREYPFGWLGILAEAPPSRDELIYQNSPRGFALYSMRSPTVTRLYLQCDPNEDIAQWSDGRIWEELEIRLQGSDGWVPQRGRIIQKGVTGMRSFVTEPMQYGRLFLLGDAAHIVPPTGAKGMNLAIADALFLSRALESFYRDNQTDKLAAYTATCLQRIWKVQRFSWWMTSMLHNFAGDSPFDRQRQLAELDYVTSSRAAATTLAENYVGLPLDL
jgi:p-hydroxybenzoate 3-monooxygenase